MKESFLKYLRTAWKVCVLYYSERPKNFEEEWRWKAEVKGGEPQILVPCGRGLVDKAFREFRDKEIPAAFMKPKGKSKPKVNIRVCC